MSPPPAVPFLLGASEAPLSPLIAFFGYLVGVFVLAWWSARVRTGEEGFVSEYFLGSRQLGSWALALTFAATAASGGTFVGFPALIHTHGWVLALWIAGYMVVPIVGMALIGKRLNHVAQTAKALTIPEVFGKRLNSPKAGVVATLLIAFFMFCYLIAQFKAGSKILATLLEETPLFHDAVLIVAGLIKGLPFLADADPGYLLCLTLFASVVVAYVMYGGFRAVVWTDVMQGILMFVGVVILLVLVLRQTGGLSKSTTELAQMTPPDHGTAVVVRPSAEATETLQVPKGSWLRGTENELVRLVDLAILPAGATESPEIKIISITSDTERARVQEITEGLQARLLSREPYAYGAGKKGVYLSAPGPDRTNAAGFLGLTMAFSYFVFWAFATTAQPSNMVRLIAFQQTRTLRRALIAVTGYFTVIYLTIIFIFCCGRVLLPGMEYDPDRTMPAMVATVTHSAGVPWLAGLLLAAPFAAVMSSVDSFLLVASSSLVRDVYQQFINTNASESKIKRLSYLSTGAVGATAFVASIKPPDYLQGIIVFASGGVAASFLVPMLALLFWRRLSVAGVIAGMLGGSLTHLVFYAMEWSPLGLDPFIWDQLGSAIALIAVSLATSPPEESLTDRFFGRAR